MEQAIKHYVALYQDAVSQLIKKVATDGFSEEVDAMMHEALAIRGHVENLAAESGIEPEWMPRAELVAA